MKNLEEWSKLKVELNSIEKQIHFHEREIWYLSI
jgi:hypothetical protein